MKDKLCAQTLGLAILMGSISRASAADLRNVAADNRNPPAVYQLNLRAGDAGEDMELYVPQAPAPQVIRGGVSPKPGAVGPLMDPRFLTLDDSLIKEARADRDRRLKATGGLPSFVPLTPIDPARDILLCVLGHGQNFHDMHAIAQLDDAYQVVLALVSDDRSMYENGRDLAGALPQLMEYRRSLSPASGTVASPELRLVTISMGGGPGQLMLQELVDRKQLYDGPDSMFSKVLFVAVDSIWRGVDAPWLAQAPGIGELSKHGVMSVANRGDVMNRLQRVRMPANVTTHFVTVRHKLTTSPAFRQFEPIANWYSNELGSGESDKLWDFLRKGETDLNKLDGFAMGGLIRKQGLQNLWRTLARDADYAAHEAEIKAAAVQAKTLEEFTARYDAAVEKIVDTFNGPEHTDFMWLDPAFLPWIRNKLKD